MKYLGDCKIIRSSRINKNAALHDLRMAINQAIMIANKLNRQDDGDGHMFLCLESLQDARQHLVDRSKPNAEDYRK